MNACPSRRFSSLAASFVTVASALLVSVGCGSEQSRTEAGTAESPAPGSSVTPPGAAEPPQDTLVIQGGSLFRGNGDSLEVNPGIVIANGRFQAVEREASQQALDAGADLIEVSEEAVVIPGLFDLHAHYAVDLRGEGRVDETEVYPILFLSNGVTSTFPAGEVQPHQMRQLRLAIEAGDRVGPRLFNSGPYFGSARDGWDPDISSDSIRAEVDYWVGQGVRGFKAKGPSTRTLRTLIERAHHHGLTVTGHLGSGQEGSVNPKDAIAMGIDRVEHFMGGDAMPPERSAYESLVNMTPDDPEFEETARIYMEEGVNFDATLSAYGYYGERQPEELYEYFHDEMKYLTPYARKVVEDRLPREANQQFERIFQVKQRLIKKFYDMGGGDLITVGTDHPSWGEYFSGFSIHRELHAFVLAGLPPAAALRSAMIDAARALGVENELGTIERGKLADLVVLRGNPLEDITNTRDPRVVVKEGQVYRPAELLPTVEGELGPHGPEDLQNW